MSSRSPTLPLSSPGVPAAAPKPPAHLFRTIKRLSSHANTHSAVYLCLTRTKIPPALEGAADTNVPSAAAEEDEDDEFRARFAKQHASFKTLPHARWLQQQLVLWEHARLSNALAHAMRDNGLSELDEQYIKVLPQLVVVKTSAQPDSLRRESEVVDFLHRGREYSTLHIGSCVLRSQITRSAPSSWVCLRPVFGATVAQFGEARKSAGGGGGMPGWLVAHVVLGVIGAVEFLAGEGVCHGKIGVENVVLSVYSDYMHYRYRGYPDVLLIDFSRAGPIAEQDGEEDARGLLGLFLEVLRRWSGAEQALKAQGAGQGTHDVMALLSREVGDLLADDNVEAISLKNIKQRFGIRLEEMRNAGPETIPRDLTKLLHADLVPEEELEFGMRKPSVLKFRARRDDFKRIVEDERVIMGSGGHAGMRGSRILVMRFTTRKAGFLRIVGEAVNTEMNDSEMAM